MSLKFNHIVVLQKRLQARTPKLIWQAMDRLSSFFWKILRFADIISLSVDELLQYYANLFIL